MTASEPRDPVRVDGRAGRFIDVKLDRRDWLEVADDRLRFSTNGELLEIDRAMVRSLDIDMPRFLSRRRARVDVRYVDPRRGVDRISFASHDVRRLLRALVTSGWTAGG